MLKYQIKEEFGGRGENTLKTGARREVGDLGFEGGQSEKKESLIGVVGAGGTFRNRKLSKLSQKLDKFGPVYLNFLFQWGFVFLLPSPPPALIFFLLF